MRIVQQKIQAALPVDRKHPGASPAVWLSGLRVGNNQHPQVVAMQATCIQPKAGQDRLRRWVPRCLHQDRPKGERLVVSPLRGYAATLSQSGFTLVELIMTMVIIGILAAVVAPRFLGVDVFKSRGFADQVQATLRYAQKEAIAQHRNVCVAITSGAISLNIAGSSGAASACNTNLVSTAGQPSTCPSATYKVCTPSAAITLSPAANFNFDALGRTWDVLGTTPSTTQKTFTISGASNNIIVEAETGYVHSP